MRRFGVTCASLPDLVSRVAPHMPADCSARGSSSVVLDVAPRLPRHPEFEGKFIYIYPSDLLSRSPGRPDRVNASKVSRLDFQRATDVCRYDLDASASTPGSIGSIGSVQGVPGWLRGVRVS